MYKKIKGSGPKVAKKPRDRLCVVYARHTGCISILARFLFVESDFCVYEFTKFSVNNFSQNFQRGSRRKAADKTPCIGSAMSAG